MSYLNIYSTKKELDNGGYDTTGFDKYSRTVQSNNGVLPTTNYYNDGDTKFCNYKSKFNDKNKIVDCIDCVSNYGFYGDRQFYCDGKCMSKHNVGQVCTDVSLVARNIDQCFNPCYASFPTTLGTQICNTDVDCNVNEICGSTGFCESNPLITAYKIGMTGFSGYTEYTEFSDGYYYKPKSMSGTTENFKTSLSDKKQNMFIGVL